jgi:hypothetical protein
MIELHGINLILNLQQYTATAHFQGNETIVLPVGSSRHRAFRGGADDPAADKAVNPVSRDACQLT